MTTYEQNQAFGGVIDALEAIGARYAIWGGLAVTSYAEPRFTQDMDVLLSPQGFDVSLFVRTLVRTHYRVDERVVRQSLTGGFFNVIHPHYGVKVDFYVPVEPELQAMLRARTYRRFDVARQAAYVTATDLVAAKLRAYEDSRSTRHLDDIASVVRLQGDNLDLERIEIAAARLGLLGVWRNVWAGNRLQ